MFRKNLGGEGIDCFLSFSKGLGEKKGKPNIVPLKVKDFFLV